MKIFKENWFYELIINLLLSVVIFNATESVVWVAIFIASAYTIPFLGKLFVNAHGISGAKATALLTLVATLVFCQVFDIGVMTIESGSGALQKHAEMAKEQCHPKLPDSFVKGTKWNEEGEKCREVKQVNTDILKEVKEEGDNLNEINFQEIIELRKRDMIDPSMLECVVESTNTSGEAVR